MSMYDNKDLEVPPGGSMDVEWLIIADAAQVVGGKLFLLGGGWDRLTINKSLPTTHKMSVAVAIQVPWNETNRRHIFKLEILDGDGVKSLGNVTGEFEVGRTVGLIEGQPQRFKLAGDVNLNVTELGTYEIVASVDGDVKKRVPFYVVAGPALQQRPPRPS